MRHVLLRAALAGLLIQPATILVAGAKSRTANSTLASEENRLKAFLDMEFAQLLEQQPQLATFLGSKMANDRLDDISDAAALRRLNWRRGSVARLMGRFDRRKLPPEAKVNYDIWVLELERAEASYRFRRYRPPFSSFFNALHTGLPRFLSNTHDVEEPPDMGAYSARLRAMPAVLDAAIAQSRASERQGIRTPKFQIERVIAESQKIINGAPFDEAPDSPLWADAKAKVGKLLAAGKVTPDGARDLLDEARSSLLGIRSGYERVIQWARGALPSAPTGRVGAVSLPGGHPWYAIALKLHTTIDLTADEIHELGLKEVARIEGEQDALARQEGFADRHAYYAERTRLFPPEPWNDRLRAEYLRNANDAIARTRQLLPSYFGLLPVHRIEVLREPSFSEVPGGGANATPPSPDGTRPGRVRVHLLGTTGDPAGVYYLMCHEAVPGHAMQFDIQARQTEAPKFRKASYNVAFLEGWGLYSEALCKEMGAYPDVAADFMRLDAELARAARLVADTGINARGWTEDQGVEYMMKSGRRGAEPARVLVRRYVTDPGQAVGYTIGLLKIMELRQKAQRELGRSFDIKEFHDLLIGSGAMPLPILERRVENWIAVKR